MFNTVNIGKTALNSPNIYPDNNNNQKNQSNVAFAARGGVVPMDIKKTIKHNKKIDKQLGEMRAYLEKFLKKGQSEVLNLLGIKNLELHPHFIERFFDRINKGRISKQKMLLDTLINGEVFQQPGFDGLIIRGQNGVNLILNKFKKGWELQTITTSRTEQPNWKKLSLK